MLELTVFKYLHPQERQSQGFYDSAVKAMQDCDVWGFEPPVLYIDINKKIKIDINIEEWEKKAINDMFEGKVSGIAKSFVHPLNFFYEEAMKQKKFLYFLERKGFPNELNFLPKEEKLNDTLKEVLSGKKTLEEFKSDIKSLINLSEKHINFRDKQMAEELETFEDKMTAFFESFQITLPENKKYVQFIGAYHNFEKIAYEKFKDNKNFSLNVFIPDVGKEYRGGLYKSIITSHAFPQGKGELTIFSDYSRICDPPIDVGFNFRNSRLKALFKAFFNKEFRELQEIKGEKVPFEVFDKIMQNVDINKFSKFNKLLEEDFERSINFRKRFGNLGESFKLGEYSIRADEYKSLEEIRKKFYKGKTFEELLEYSRIKVSQFEENYRVTYLNLSKLDLEEIPEELNVFTQLEKLFLWGNKIKEIENLDNLKNLKKLYLMKNKISEIQGLDNLVELQELYLGYNALSDWSLKETLNLPQLQILNLDFNGGFYDVEHKTFKNLKQLKKLSIRTGGMLHRINVENLTELETLNLEVQALLNINGLENLTKLKTLNLRGNPHFSEHMTAILLELKDKDVDVKYDYFDF